MNQLFRPAACLALIAFISCGHAAVVPTPSNSGDAATIRATLDSTAAAWNRGDLNGYLAAYVDSAMEMGATGVETGRSRIEATMKAGFWRTGRPLQTLHYENVEVRPLGGDKALVTGRFVLTGAGRPDRTGVFTTLWLRTAAGWRMFYDHSG
jgi:ketosteroid isomerase-like protein